MISEHTKWEKTKHILKCHTIMISVYLIQRLSWLARFHLNSHGLMKAFKSASDPSSTWIATLKRTSTPSLAYCCSFQWYSDTSMRYLHDLWHFHFFHLKMANSLFLFSSSVHSPIFVPGSPPVGIGHLQDGVLLIFPQLQVLWRLGLVVVLCYDGHAHRWALRFWWLWG